MTRKKILRKSYRVTVFFILLLSYLVSSSILYIRHRDQNIRRRRLSQNASFFCRLVLKFFQIKVNFKNQPPHHLTGLVVGNHMGYVDNIIIKSVMPAYFVTSVEMRETPLLGTIAEFAGCIYVERRSRTHILNELENLIDSLKRNERIVIYPEATSHNGEEILPFKRTLLTAAAHAQKPILPYVVNYIKIDGADFSLKNRDSVCWWGDMSFITSANHLLGAGEIFAEVEFLEPVYPTPEEDRGKVADSIREMIVNKFVPIFEKRSN